MRHRISWLFFLCAGMATLPVAHAQQTQADSYTRYELLAPQTNSFRIIYDVSATSAGAVNYFNTLRKGSEHEVTAVYDRMTGRALDWSIRCGFALKRPTLIPAGICSTGMKWCGTGVSGARKIRWSCPRVGI